MSGDEQVRDKADAALSNREPAKDIGARSVPPKFEHRDFWANREPAAPEEK